MQSMITCPICEAASWRTLGERSYASESGDAGDYLRRRMRVLFELWFPGETEVTISSVMCETCGFVCYMPRPTEKDLDDKYQFLTSLGPDGNDDRVDPSVEKDRAEQLWKRLRRDLPREGGRVLDFGGGDGRLLTPFVQHGHACFVIDYSPSVVPGVSRLGSTLDDAETEGQFDAVICSHVLEHVADPVAILQRLRALMKVGGTIYVEVPMEIWRKPPLHPEPVTHVNFFTDESTRVMLENAGFASVQSRLGGYRHPLGHRTVVVRATGRKDAEPERAARLQQSVDRTREMLNPGWPARVQRHLLNPARLPAAVYHKLVGNNR